MILPLVDDAGALHSINSRTRRALIGLLYGDADEAALARVTPTELLQAAVTQQVGAHLLWRLEQRTFEDRDAAVTAERLAAGLKQLCLRDAALNLRRDVLVRPSVAQMAEVGIRVMLLKGTALRARYVHMAGRPQCDTDVMVPREDLDRAEAILMAAGYESDDRLMTREEYLEKHFHLRLARDGNIIELHWTMSNECAAGAVERSWDRAEPIVWHGVPAWLPSAEDELVFTQVHLSRHLFDRGLRWVGDLLYQVERGPRLGERLASVRRDWPLRFIDAPVVATIGLKSYDYPYEFSPHGSATRLDGYFLRSLARSLLLDRRWYGLDGWKIRPALIPWLWHGQGSLSVGVALQLGRLIADRLHGRKSDIAPAVAGG